MENADHMRHTTVWKVVSLCFLCAALGSYVTAQEIALRCDPAHTAADFTLGDVLHTVHGTFQEKSCDFRFEPASEKVSGQIIFDATSGDSGSEGRDRKMHKDVLESARYPEISFRPDRIDGKVATSGTSTVQVHGMFAIHGAEHEITTPVTITFDADHWEVSAHFPVPYAKWGMKNPSVFLLRVGDTVMIDLHAAGTAAAPATP
jgi:polyisoprenoid-binding protein YceI